MQPLIKFEAELLSKGIRRIAGVDEAGRGALAGPLVIASVIFKPEILEKYIELTHYDKANPKNNDVIQEKNGTWILQINDSKKLSAKTRGMLYKQILQVAETYKIMVISNVDIDKKGISWANSWGFHQAIANLTPKPKFVLSDHFQVEGWPKDKQLNINKGDALSISIAGASILAKVYRDRLMLELDKKYPKYKFSKHKGYGTRFHRETILREGPCEIHRYSFEPVKSLRLN